MVDDESDVTVTLKMALEDSGSFEVDTFVDSASALSMFRPGLYDLALLDIRMPKMNGFQLFRKLRDIDDKLKTCFLTAANLTYYGETDSDVINDLGTDCFVAKPVRVIDLISRLKDILSYK
ncbi:MAG TPA: response regulator [Nitrososphaeraceae archaeon]|jgi:DNA-binding response OmpR family regulator|nr:response regulator [Nitrososphaeraceae archaeon]